MPGLTQRNFRLRPVATRVLERLAEKFGIDQTAVLHLAIQRLGQQELREEKKSRENSEKTT